MIGVCAQTYICPQNYSDRSSANLGTVLCLFLSSSVSLQQRMNWWEKLVTSEKAILTSCEISHPRYEATVAGPPEKGFVTFVLVTYVFPSSPVSSTDFPSSCRSGDRTVTHGEKVNLDEMDHA